MLSRNRIVHEYYYIDYCMAKLQQNMAIALIYSRRYLLEHKFYRWRQLSKNVDGSERIIGRSFITIKNM